MNKLNFEEEKNIFQKCFIRNLEPSFNDKIPDELEDRVEKRDFAEFVRLKNKKTVT